MSPSPAADGPARGRDATRTRAELLDAARRLVAEHGSHGVSTRMIAAHAGVNQALVYRYFGSKEALLLEAVGQRESPFGQLLAGTPVDELSALFVDRMLSEAWEEDRRRLGLMVAASNDEMVRELVRNIIDTVFGEDLGGRLPGERPRLRAELVAALFVGMDFLRTRIGTRALAEADGAELAPLFGTLLDTLIHGAADREVGDVGDVGEAEKDPGEPLSPRA